MRNSALSWQWLGINVAVRGLDAHLIQDLASPAIPQSRPLRWRRLKAAIAAEASVNAAEASQIGPSTKIAIAPCPQFAAAQTEKNTNGNASRVTITRPVLIQIPRFDVQYLLDSGELVEVMPEARAAPMPVSLLYPHRRQRSRRLTVFLDWFEALMQPHLEA